MTTHHFGARLAAYALSSSAFSLATLLHTVSAQTLNPAAPVVPIPLALGDTEFGGASGGMLCKAQNEAGATPPARLCNAAGRPADRSQAGIFRWEGYILPEVRVTATRFAEPAASLPLGVSVLTTPEIRASGASTINEAIGKLLGVPTRLDTSGGNNQALDLRGFGATSSSNQVYVIDGLRLNEADLSSARLSSIPIETVERIEVLRGSGAVLYGEGATGGVVLITTQAGHGADRSNAARLYSAAGSYGLRESRAGATLATHGFTLDVDGQHRTADNHRDNFAARADGLNVAAQWRNDWLRVGARAGQDDLHSGLPGALSAADYAAKPEKASNLTDSVDIRSRSQSVFAQAELGAWQLAADTHARSKSLLTPVVGSNYGYDVDARNSSVRARHEAQGTSFSNALIVGVDTAHWQRVITRTGFGVVGAQAQSDSTAYFFKNDVTLAATGTRLSLGGRSEKIRKNEQTSAAKLENTQHAWELGISQPVSAQASVYARTGTSFRLANVDEFSFTNPAVMIRPQTSRDSELGAKWKNAHTQIDARFFLSRLTDEIAYDPQANGLFSPFFNGANVNLDPTQRKGVELDLTHAFSSTLSLRANAMLRSATFRAGPYVGNTVPLVPRRSAALQVRWTPSREHQLNVGAHWVSSAPVEMVNTCRVPAYATWDARYAYQPAAFSKVELALGVDNLSNRKYYTQAFGCTASGATTSLYPEAGRAFTASVRVKF